MENNKNSLEDLKLLRTFMKGKKITFDTLRKEMEYSKNHVITVFNGKLTLTDKFMRSAIKAIQRILQKDMETFDEVMGRLVWMKNNSQPRIVYPSADGSGFQVFQDYF